MKWKWQKNTSKLNIISKLYFKCRETDWKQKIKSKYSYLLQEKVDKSITDYNNSNKFWFDACKLKEQIKTILKHTDRYFLIIEKKSII